MFTRHYDVVVVGGGVAGFSAALAAAHNGANTLLVEAGPAIGGEAISGLPLLGCRSAAGEWIVGGVLEQLLSRCEQLDGYVGSFFDWRLMWGTCIDPVIMQVVIAEALENTGVTVLLHSLVEDVVLTNNELTGLIIRARGELIQVQADTFIDCSGDAAVAAMSGVSYVTSDESGTLQPVSMTFRVANLDFAALLDYVEFHPEDLMLAESSIITKNRAECAKEIALSGYPFFSLDVKGPLLQRAVQSGELFPCAGMWFTPNSLVRNEIAINATRVAPVDATNAEELSATYFPLLRQVTNAVDFLRRSLPGFERAVLSGLAPRIGIRETRRICGERTLSTEQVIGAFSDPEGIAKGSHHVDIHGSGTAQTRIPVKGGGSYDIPYGCLIPESVERLLVAGRCISSTREANGSARVSGTCLAMGQAAGTAAALAVRDDIFVRKLDVHLLQNTLEKQGAIVAGSPMSSDRKEVIGSL